MRIELENIRKMVDVMPGNYLVLQATGTELEFVHYTEGIPALSGRTKEEYDGIANVFDIILEDDRVVMNEKIKVCLEDDQFQETDLLFRLKHKEQGFVWTHLTVKKYGVVDGTIIYIASLFNVTKETMISYALMGASDRFICVIEKATKRFLYANEGFYDLIDSNPADAMGKYCYELLCKVMEMKDNDDCLCYSSINADPPLEMYNPDKDMHLTLSGKEVQWGEYAAYVFFLTDVTEKKRSAQLLADSQKRFEVALDNSDLMIWEYDMVNNRCINSEKAGRDYDIPLVIENYPESLFETGHTPPETVEQIKDVKRRLFQGETGFSVERRTVDKFGKSIWQKVEYSLECDQDGKPIRAIVCGLDITEQKELEQKYEEQMEYRNRFAQNAMFSVRMDLDGDSIIDYTCSDSQLEGLMAASKNAT